MKINRHVNRSVAKIITRLPSLSKRFLNSFAPLQSSDVPWAVPQKPLSDSKVAIVTTAGLHFYDQQPFNMDDTDGDATFREIDVSRPLSDLRITHDYYDHSDAEKDVNIVFPIERLWEMEKQGGLGKVTEVHYSFMGHIDGPHVATLMERTAPEVAKKLKSDGVDIVLLTPA